MKTLDRWLTSPWRRSVTAALAGALPMLAFPAPSLWWFAYVALVPWLLLARSAPTGDLHIGSNRYGLPSAVLHPARKGCKNT